MSVTFDSLAYAKALESAGLSRDIAEAHATATREFIMQSLVTKADLEEALERHALKLTIRLGGLMVAGIGALAVLTQLGA